jgi:hypothetical protein
MQTIYNRVKTAHGWRYERVGEGRGIRTGLLKIFQGFR